MKTKAAVVNGLAGAQAAAIAVAVTTMVVQVDRAGASGTSSAAGGSDSTGTPSTKWPADGVGNMIGLHNTWKLS